MIDHPPPAIRAWLSSLELLGIKLGLDTMRALSRALDAPERAWRAVHIGGTNGKGSVAAITAHGLQAAGHLTGRYTSPHLVRLEERVVVSGLPVRAAELDEALARVHDAIDALRLDGTLSIHPTFFEVTTAAAFDAFRTAGVETAVVEVGLGGRFDATNIVEPMATALTTIDFDHEQTLGRTLREIAFEKAGILKPGVPVVTGALSSDARDEVARIAAERGVPLIEAPAGTEIRARRRDGLTELALATPVRRYGPVTMALRGAHQVHNAVVAVRLLEVLEERGLRVGGTAIEAALAEARWPARLDLRTLADGRAVLIDGAHNPSGAAALAAYVAEEWPQGLPVVFGAMADKDLRGMLQALGRVARPLVVTRAPGRRAAAPDMLQQVARESGIVRQLAAHALEQALDEVWRHGHTIVVAGSLYLAGAALTELGLG